MKWLGAATGVVAIVDAARLGGRLGVIAAAVEVLFALLTRATAIIIAAIGVGLDGGRGVVDGAAMPLSLSLAMSTRASAPQVPGG